MGEEETTEQSGGGGGGRGLPGGMPSGIPDFTDPLAKLYRKELDVHYNIYELPNFGDDVTNQTMKELVSDLKSALMLNYTNPTDPEGNVKLQCHGYNRLGIAYYRLLRFNLAEVCHRKHLKLSQAGDPKNMMERNRKLNPVEMRISLVNIGTVFHAKGDNELALSAYDFALEKAEEVCL